MLTHRFENALVLAAQLHRRQVRKASSTPYVAHLLSVAALVLEHGGGEDEAIAALLHDAIEDQGGADLRELIRRQFGPAVAEIVDGCTDAETIPKPPWRQRKEAHLVHLATASTAVRLVAAADKVHNGRSILSDHARLGEEVWNRFNAPKAAVQWYYRAMGEVLQQAGGGPLAEEAARIAQALAAL